MVRALGQLKGQGQSQGAIMFWGSNQVLQVGGRDKKRVAQSSEGWGNGNECVCGGIGVGEVRLVM